MTEIEDHVPGNDPVTTGNVTGLQKAVKLEEIPEERWPTVVRRTVIGTALIAFGVAGMALYGMNHYLAAGFVVVGATTWSSQLVTASIKALIEPIAAIKRAIGQ